MLTFSQYVKRKYGADASVSNRRGRHIELNDLSVPKDSRGQGTGTKVMDDLHHVADRLRKGVALTPAEKGYKGSTSRSRLERFYKARGYRNNKGKSRDFSTTHSMIRDPR